MCAAVSMRAVTYYPPGEGGMDDMCGCFVLQERVEKSGTHSPVDTSGSDWFPWSKSPIREPQLIQLTEEGAGRIKAR